MDWSRGAISPSALSISMEYLFEILAVIVGVIVGWLAASADYFHERNRRLKWMLAMVATFCTGVVAIGVLYAKRAEQLAETHTANLAKDSLNRRLDINLDELRTLQNTVESASENLDTLIDDARTLDENLRIAKEEVDSLGTEANAIREAIALQHDAVTNNLLQTQRLAYPIRDLSIEAVLALPLSDPALQPYITRLKTHIDTLMAQNYGNGFITEQGLTVVYRRGTPPQHVTVRGDSPWFLNPRLRDELVPAFDWGIVGLGVYLFPPLENPDPTRDRPAIVFRARGFSPHWIGVAGIREVPASASIPSLEVNFSADSLYYRLRANLDIDSQTSHRISGIIDLPGSWMLLDYTAPRTAELRELRIFYGARSEAPLLLRKSAFHLNHGRLAHQFSQREVDALLGLRSSHANR